MFQTLRQNPALHKALHVFNFLLTWVFTWEMFILILYSSISFMALVQLVGRMPMGEITLAASFLYLPILAVYSYTRRLYSRK